MATSTLDYRDGDTVCEAFVAAPEDAATKRPGVLVFHQWAGQIEHERNTALALAEMGYVGFAADVYGKGVRGDPMGDNSALMHPYASDRALLRQRIRAAATAASTHPAVDGERLAAVGYCFGGLCALDLARAGAPGLRGAVSFHGVLAAPGLGEQAPIAAKILVLHGYADPMAKPDALLALAEELTEAKADWQIHAYGHAMHAFTAKGVDAPERGLRYDASADRRSWAAMRYFLEEALA